MTPGSQEQLVFTLIACYLTSCAYTAFKPFRENSDDRLQEIAQFGVFFAILSSIIRQYLTHDAILDALVTALLFIPPAVVLVYNLKLCCPKFCAKPPSAPLLAPLLRSVNANGG